MLAAMVVGAPRGPSHLAAPSAPAGAQGRRLMGWGGVLGPGSLLAVGGFFCVFLFLFLPLLWSFGKQWDSEIWEDFQSLDTPWVFLLMIKAENEL